MADRLASSYSRCHCVDVNPSSGTFSVADVRWCAPSHVAPAKLADKLEKWVDDPETLPPISAMFKGPFFGTHKTDPEYEQARDMYRTEAKDEAKMIRKAVSWLNDPPANPNVMTEYRHTVYRTSW